MNLSNGNLCHAQSCSHQDSETNFYYLQSRYYNPSVGRFINADEPMMLSILATNMIHANLFAYCGNNAVNYSDPTGYWKIPLSAIGKILMAFAINPIPAVLIGIGIYKFKIYLSLKFTWLIAKLGAFWGPVVQGVLIAIAAITGIFIIAPIAVAIFDAIVQRKKGVEITPKKTWFGMPYGINVGIY